MTENGFYGIIKRNSQQSVGERKMDLEIYQLILIALIVACASYIQSVTGFGFGIFAMMFLPYILLYTEANILSSIISALTSVGVAIALWRKISWKNIIFPLIGCVITTYAAVVFISSQETRVLKILLGIALVALSIYFYLFSGKIKIKPTWYAGLIAGLLSGIMGGMFSMGGPPVVIYFIQSEDDSDNYLATISAYFVFSGAISIIMKASSGFMTSNVWFALIVGIIGLLLGATLGKLTRDKTKPQMIKKAVYAVMAVSGVINIVTSLFF